MNKNRIVACLIVASACSVGGLAGLPAPAGAQLPPRDQRDPNLTYLDDREEYLLAWSEDRGGGSLIYAKRIRANGFAIGGSGGGEWQATNVFVSPSAPVAAKGDQRWPALIDDLIVYSERLPGAADYDVYAQRLFANGRPSGAPMLVAGGPGDQRYPDVLAVSRGRQGSEYFIVWSEDTRDAGDIMGIRVDYALRRSRGPAFPIAQGPGTAEDPAITRDLLEDNYYVVVFTDDRAGNKDIYAVRLVASGLPRGGPTSGPFKLVDTPTDDYAPEIVSTIQELGTKPTATPDRRTPTPRPRASTMRNLLVWTTDDPVNGPEVAAQRLGSNGALLGQPFLVAGGPGLQAWPAATLRLPDYSLPGRDRERAEWLAVWCDDGLGTLDVTSVAIDTNGLVRERPRVVASD